MTAPEATAAEATVPEATVPATEAPVDDLLVATIIGDSYSTGSLTEDGQVVNWSAILEQGLRDNGVPTALTLAAVGATGYVAGHENGDTFADRVAGSVTPRTELVIVFGSRNDGPALLEPSGIDELRAAATATYATIRAIAPGATLVVIGAPWVSEAVPPEIASVQSVLLGVADDFGAVFVDPLAAGWFFGDAHRFIGDDGVHPTAAGQEYMAERILPVVLDVAHELRLCATNMRVRPPSCDRVTADG